MQLTSSILLILVIGMWSQTGNCMPVHRQPRDRTNGTIRFENDIMLTTEQMKVIDGVKKEDRENTTNGVDIPKRTFHKFSRRWPGGIVYYTINDDIAFMTEEIKKAMTHIEVNTCIQFKPKASDTPNYLILKLFLSNYCYAPLGMELGPGVVGLNKNCNMGIIAHELLHALGMLHEHTRPDRDSYVKVIEDNIGKADDGTSNLDQFAKYAHEKVDMTVPYDIGSLMHYGPTESSKDGNSTVIVALDKSKQHLMGQTAGLSAGDIETINKVYECKASNGESGTGTIKDCKATAVGTKYAGTTSVTKSGATCLKWEGNVKSADGFPEDTLTKAENYCRNPDSTAGGPWCFTSIQRDWESCNIPLCAAK